MDLGLAGLASGFDWRSFVDQMLDVERAPQRRLQGEQSVLQQRNTAITGIKTQLDALAGRVKALQTGDLFDSRAASTSDPTLASVTASAGASLGEVSFLVTHLASASRQEGTAGVAAPLSASGDVSGVILGTAAFGAPVSAGTFTINGRQVTIAATDSLQSVFDQIATETNGSVTAAYDSATDRVTLTGSGPIILGSSVDSSNFLQALRLNNNGTNTVTSGASLGGVRYSGSLDAANLVTPISDGGGGLGEFRINGVSIMYNAATDSVANVLQRINNSSAGVTAGYDSASERFVLTNRITGDLGLALEDVTGNFLAASGLGGGSLTRGENLAYSVNGGSEITSLSNTITESSSGVAGLAVSVLKTGTFTTSVASDTVKIKQALNDLLADYNKAQSLIETNTASSTDAQGKIKAGLLAADGDVSAIGAVLRSTLFRSVSGLSGAITHLEALGITSNGNDNSLRVADEKKLAQVLAESPDKVKALFTDSTDGLAVRLQALLDKTIGDSGTLVTHQEAIDHQVTAMTSQLAGMERLVLSNKDRLTNSFVAMETAQAKINQQLSYLQKQFA